MWKIILAFIVGFLVCALLMFIIAMRSERKRKHIKITINTFAKLIVAVTVAHGMILTTLSYILAFYEKDTVCSVSEVIVREIVAPVLVYLATNMIMNIFEKNKLAFSVPINTIFIGKDGKEHNYSGTANNIEENTVG